MQVGSLAMAVNSKSSFLRGSERSLRLAVGLLTKTFLQNLGRLQDHPEFPHLWNRILQVSTLSMPRLALPRVSCCYAAFPLDGSKMGWAKGNVTSLADAVYRDFRLR